MAENYSKIAIGTVQFGLDYGISNETGKTSREEGLKILDQAYSNGITTVDTAYQYGNSEEVLGALNVSKFQVVSKFPGLKDELTVRNFLERSLENLNLSSVQGYLAHSAQSILDHPEVWLELQQLKAEGLVSKIGVSLYAPDELDQLAQLSIHPDLIQVPYNIFDTRFESLFPQLESQGVEIHTRSTFMQGLFFMNPDELNPFFSEIVSDVKDLQKVFTTNKALSSALLTFALDNPYISKVVIGINTAEQLTEILDGLNENKEKIENRFMVKDENILLPYKWPKR